MISNNDIKYRKYFAQPLFELWLLVLFLRRQLLYNIVRILPRQRHILRMTTPGKYLALSIREMDRRKRQSLANCNRN